MNSAAITSLLYLGAWVLFIVALFIVPRNRKPGEATAWLMLIFLLPYFGFLLFLIFGSPKLSKGRRARLPRRVTEMFARKGVFSSIGRAATLATVAAVVLTAIEPMAYAASAPRDRGVTVASGTSDATDISARRRYYRGSCGAAAAAAFAGIVGTGLAIAAAQNRRDYYDSYGYYGGGPVYYGGGPYYGYGGGYYGGYRSGVPYYRGHPNAGW